MGQRGKRNERQRERRELQRSEGERDGAWGHAHSAVSSGAAGGSR